MRQDQGEASRHTRSPAHLYRCLVAGLDMRQVLFDYLACDRVLAAWAKKSKARSEDLAWLRRAVETY